MEGQAPILGVVRDEAAEEIERREDEVCRDVADCLEGFAVTLPPSSEIRALLLRSSARWTLLSGDERPHPRPHRVPSARAG